MSSFGRGGREAEGTALLRRHTGNCIEGSNPSLSAANDYAAIAQLDRASVYGTEGRRFESFWPRKVMNDVEYMRQAIVDAQAAGALGEVPVGAVVVVDGKIVGRGGNRRESAKDPTAHAEMIAIREAALAVGGWRLVGATLYVTQEPCPMCAGAIVNARVERVVFGCDNPKAGAVKTLYRMLEDERLNHRVAVEQAAPEVAAECGALLTSFFEELRRH